MLCCLAVWSEWTCQGLSERALFSAQIYWDQLELSLSTCYGQDSFGQVLSWVQHNNQFQTPVHKCDVFHMEVPLCRTSGHFCKLSTFCLDLVPFLGTLFFPRLIITTSDCYLSAFTIIYNSYYKVAIDTFGIQAKKFCIEFGFVTCLINIKLLQRYSLKHLYPDSFAFIDILKASCKFWIILQEYCKIWLHSSLG